MSVGYSAAMGILTEDMREALMVPKTAVLAEGDLSIVFTVRNGQAYKITLDLQKEAFAEAPTGHIAIHDHKFESKVGMLIRCNHRRANQSLTPPNSVGRYCTSFDLF